MPRQHTRRGRPKGSGLDDGKYLKSISDLISADPTLKPTTAIKSLGISNPSTIRRLRDKYNAFQKSAPADVKPVVRAQKSVAGTSHGTSQTEAQNLVAAASEQSQRPSPTKRKPNSASMNPTPGVSGSTVADLTAAVSADAAPADPFAEQAKWLGMMCEIGMHGVSSAMMINASACKSFVALPPVKWACQNQIAVNQMMLEMLRRSTHPETSTIH